MNLPWGFWGAARGNKTGPTGPPIPSKLIILSLLPSSCCNSIRAQLLAGGPGKSQLLQHKPGDPGAAVHHLPSFHQVSRVLQPSFPLPLRPSRVLWAAIPQFRGCFKMSPLVEGTGSRAARAHCAPHPLKFLLCAVLGLQPWEHKPKQGRALPGRQSQWGCLFWGCDI